MRNYARIAVVLTSLPIFVSLAGCPALAVARIAKKASEPSSSSDKDAATKSDAVTSPAPATPPKASGNP